MPVALDLEQEAFVDVRTTDDAKVGIQSFLDHGPGKAAVLRPLTRPQTLTRPRSASFSRARLPCQSRRSTGLPACSPATLPSHHGNRSRSSQQNWVAPSPHGYRRNSPSPVTAPRCAIPIATPGSHTVTTKWSVVCSGPTRVRQSNSGADTRVLRAAERDRLRVLHPLDVALDVLDRGPHVFRRRGDRGAHADRDHGRTSFRVRAACAGSTVFTKRPVACSKPATHGETRRDLDVPVERRRGRWRAVDTTLYGGSSSARAKLREGVARRERDAHDLVVGRAVEVRARLHARDAQLER